MQTLAVKSDAATQVLVDYLNAANEVARYAVQVGTATLPVLITPPDKYGDYAVTLGKAKGHALSWINEMVPAFTAIPSAIVNFNGIVQPQLETVKTNLDKLQANPGDAAAKAAITNAVEVLKIDLAPCVKAVTDLDGWISNYNGDLAPDATALSKTCSDIVASEKADQASIDKLKAVLGNLQTLVAKRNELVTLDIVGNATLSVFLGVAGVAVGVPFAESAVVSIIVGLGVGIGSGIFTALVPLPPPVDYAQSLASIQSEMDRVNIEIGGVNAVVGLLQATSDALSQLVTSSSATSKSAQDVLTFWKQIQTNISTTVADIDAILKDLVDSGGIPAAIVALTAAQKSWSDLEASMQGMGSMSYEVSSTMDMPAIHPPIAIG